MKVPSRIGAFLIAAATAGLATPYPALDTSTPWSIRDWGFNPGQGFTFQGLSKRVWSGPGQSFEKMAFYSISLRGVRIAGVDYPLSDAHYLGEMEGPGYVSKFGSFGIVNGATVTASFYFHDDGKFEVNTNLSAPPEMTGAAAEVIVHMDYDMGGSDNNIAEFLWNRGSEGLGISPPQGAGSLAEDGRLEFTGSADADYWSTVDHEITVAYAAPPADGRAVEKPAFARILNASRPQFGMVLWNGADTPLEATFKGYGPSDGSLEPRPDVSSALQWTGEYPGYPRYAFAGADQVVSLRLAGIFNETSPKFSGKLFQKPGERPLALSVHQHPPGDLGDWSFDADYPARVSGGDVRTFRTALEGLTGEGNLDIRAGGALDYLPYEGYADPRRPVTEAQLHNLMLAARDYTDAALENVKDWKLDLYLVNWTLEGSPDAMLAMFDYGGANDNHIAREGAAVFWPALGGGGEDRRRREGLLSALQATGLALNMHPAWSNCPFVGYCWSDPSGCGGARCGDACPPGAQGCRYQAYTCRQECTEGTVMSFADAEGSSFEFNSSPAQGNDFSELDWYRDAPESWVKPGRFGVSASLSPVLPAFQTE